MRPIVWRATAILFLLAVLFGLFVWAGTVDPATTDNSHPGATEIHENPDQYLGERVTVSGTVVDTHPLIVEVNLGTGDATQFVVENADSEATVGEYLRIYGTLQSETRIDAANTIDNEPWEFHYMYLVSVLAGLWVLARTANHWIVDTTTWSVRQRTEALIADRR